MRRFASNPAARRLWAALIAAGVFAVAAHWLEPFRLVDPEHSAGTVFRVTSQADAGAGSLREAILGADRAGQRARIELAVEKVVLASPLPALLNPHGVVVDATRSRTLIDASAIDRSPVFDLAAPDAVVTGVRIAYSAGAAVLVRRGHARLHGISVEDSQYGVFVADRASNIVIERSTFQRNDVGVYFPADAARAVVQDSRFQEHRRAAVWAVAPRPAAEADQIGINLVRNEFQDDRQSLVLVNVGARIEQSVFTRARVAAAHLTGGSFIVRRNRFVSGRGFGVNAEGLHVAVIADNELAHNCFGGILVKESRDTRVMSNRIYANGYGIVMVFGSPDNPNTVADNLVIHHAADGLLVIGASPVIRENRLFQNRQAGIRLSTTRNAGGAAAPLLHGNVLAGNGIDEVRRDEYAGADGGSRVAEPADCSGQGPRSGAVAIAAGGLR